MKGILCLALVRLLGINKIIKLFKKKGTRKLGHPEQHVFSPSPFPLLIPLSSAEGRDGRPPMLRQGLFIFTPQDAAISRTSMCRDASSLAGGA